jgi:hypothetical protein
MTTRRPTAKPAPPKAGRPRRDEAEPSPVLCVPEPFDTDLYYDAEAEHELIRKAVRGRLKARWEGR